MQDNKEHFNKLHDNWTLWSHLPNDIDWTIDSYKSIYSFDSVEEGICLIETINEKLLFNTMFFMMRSSSRPYWEDDSNKNGGAFSFKVNNKYLLQLWKNLSYSLVGEVISDDNMSNINGISFSPKKNFCIVKIWLSDSSKNNLESINDIEFLPKNGLFKEWCV